MESRRRIEMTRALARDIQNQIERSCELIARATKLISQTAVEPREREFPYLPSFGEDGGVNRTEPLSNRDSSE